MMGDVMQRTAGLRRPGAAALDLAYVAAGFTDGFFETGLKPWDVAAGSLLVTEAGGLIGNFAGEAGHIDQPECLAANPRVYAQLVAILRKHSRFDSAVRTSDERREVVSLKKPADASDAAFQAWAGDAAAPTEPAATPAAEPPHQP
jgi:myo-inositol-1(or 4)-monophosphatase